MSNVLTLDTLRDTVRRQFAPVKVELGDGSTVTLSSLLRLDPEPRKAVKSALEDIGESDSEEDSPEAAELLIEAFSKIFNAIADKPAKLLRETDDDDVMVKAAVMSRIVSLWIEATQLGEA